MKCKQCGMDVNNDSIINAINILDKIISALPKNLNHQEHELDQSLIDIMFPDSNDIERFP